MSSRSPSPAAVSNPSGPSTGSGSITPCSSCCSDSAAASAGCCMRPPCGCSEVPPPPHAPGSAAGGPAASGTAAAGTAAAAGGAGRSTAAGADPLGGGSRPLRRLRPGGAYAPGAASAGLIGCVLSGASSEPAASSAFLLTGAGGAAGGAGTTGAEESSGFTGARRPGWRNAGGFAAPGTADSEGGRKTVRPIVGGEGDQGRLGLR
jgi:hypothetical protein